MGMKDKNAVALGKKGGLATAKIPGHLQRISKLGVEARKRKQAQIGTVLPIDNKPTA